MSRYFEDYDEQLSHKHKNEDSLQETNQHSVRSNVANSDIFKFITDPSIKELLHSLLLGTPIMKRKRNTDDQSKPDIQSGTFSKPIQQPDFNSRTLTLRYSKTLPVQFNNTLLAAYKQTLNKMRLFLNHFNKSIHKISANATNIYV